MSEQRKCSQCGSTETTVVLLDDGPHYGKLICTTCEWHHRWLPKPKEPAGEPMPIWLHELAVRPHRSARLVGTESQCQWAESIRTEMKAKHQHDAVMVGILDAISDATWFIANKDEPTPRWPQPCQIEEAITEYGNGPR